MQKSEPNLRANTMTSRLILSLVCISAISATATAETPAPIGSLTDSMAAQAKSRTFSNANRIARTPRADLEL